MSAENACTSLCKVSVNLSDFDQTWNGLTHFNGTPKYYILSFVLRCFPFLDHILSGEGWLVNNELEWICKKSGSTRRGALQALSRETLGKHSNKFGEEFIAYFPFIQHGLHIKRRFQQFFYCSVCIRWRCNFFNELLTNNDGECTYRKTDWQRDLYSTKLHKDWFRHSTVDRGRHTDTESVVVS
jgi:hypothetical protein